MRDLHGERLPCPSLRTCPAQSRGAGLCHPVIPAYAGRLRDELCKAERGEAAIRRLRLSVASRESRRDSSETRQSTGRTRGGRHTGFKAVSTGRGTRHPRHCGLDPQSRGAATAGTPSIPIHMIPPQHRHSRAGGNLQGGGANVLFFESGFLGLWRIYRTEAICCIILWIHAFCESTNKHATCTVNSNRCVYVKVL